MSALYASIACNLDADMLSASLPLLEEGRVEALEWSFDALFRVKEVPEWFDGLIDTFSKAGRLVGHGVFFSLFSGKWLPGQQEWLRQLRAVCERFHFDHITEHFGFMTGPDFHSGAPLNIPYTPQTLAIGRDRLARIADACGCPVGLENLAFSYTEEEVKRHGAFLEELIAPVNGFIILDLHNLYCQLHNFSIGFEALIRHYPLERVREIHISGGSWAPAPAAPGHAVRRDTHDDKVPEEVFRLLQQVIPLCPQLKFVVMEQLGAGLQTVESRQGFYDDFLEMNGIIKAAADKRPAMMINDFMPVLPVTWGPAVEDEMLYSQQMELSAILETAGSYEEVTGRLQSSSLADTAWQIESWKPYMLETAMQIAQKWRRKEA